MLRLLSLGIVICRYAIRDVVGICPNHSVPKQTPVGPRVIPAYSPLEVAPLTHSWRLLMGFHARSRIFAHTLRTYEITKKRPKPWRSSMATRISPQPHASIKRMRPKTEKSIAEKLAFCLGRKKEPSIPSSQRSWDYRLSWPTRLWNHVRPGRLWNHVRPVFGMRAGGFANGPPTAFWLRARGPTPAAVRCPEAQ